jgi:serine/threonine protein kinase
VLLECDTVFAGSFKILGLLGQGSFGVVYKAEQISLGRTIALKVLKPADPAVLARFQQEGQILTRLRHKNICQCLVYGVDSDLTPYMALELIEGLTLRSILEQRRLHWKEAIGIGTQICSGLEAAHNAGITHRDLKPENLMLLSDGTIKILDFGMSADLNSENQKITSEHQTVGTPQYMSPEQCRHWQIDHRSDLYSLGCILFESIAGRPPFIAQNELSVMVQHNSSKPPSLEEFAPVPLQLAGIIGQSLEKDPDARFQSAQIFADELQSTLNMKESTAKTNARFPITLHIDKMQAAALLPLALIVFIVLFCGSHSSKTSQKQLASLKPGSGSAASSAKVTVNGNLTQHTEANERLAQAINHAEHAPHRDQRLLFDAYLQAIQTWSNDSLLPESYALKADAIASGEQRTQLMKALWFRSIQSADMNALRMLPILQRIAERVQNLGYMANCHELGAELSVRAGDPDAAEKHAALAYSLIRGLSGHPDWDVMKPRMFALLLGSNKERTKQLIALDSPDFRPGVLVGILQEYAMKSGSSTQFIRCVSAQTALLQGDGKFIQMSGPLTAKYLEFFDKDPTLRMELFDTMFNGIDAEEQRILLTNALYALAESNSRNEADQLLRRAKALYSNDPRWPLTYQAYLDKLTKSNQNDEKFLRSVLPLYDENLPKVRASAGANSESYAMVFWIRAHLHMLLKERDAALADFDECKKIVSHADCKSLNLWLIEKDRNVALAN